MQGGVVCGGGGEQAADGTPAGGRTHNQRNIIVPVIPSYRFRDSHKRSLAHSSSPTSSSPPRRLSSVIHPFAAHTSDVFFFLYKFSFLFSFLPQCHRGCWSAFFHFMCYTSSTGLTPLVQTSGKEMRAVKAQFSLLKRRALLFA